MCRREARVWDLRTATKPSPKPVCHLAHPKGLTSAFYSPRGSYLLTTCNDDRLRVYDVSSTNRPPEKELNEIISNWESASDMSDINDSDDGVSSRSSDQEPEHEDDVDSNMTQIQGPTMHDTVHLIRNLNMKMMSITI
uniref:Uncharacterized protein n=1 Tax=Timema douglasi TaxID=61478 RepID=A0A7R8VY53_TIMDO|nr:unnamed protein product [Timema douglasi]